MMASSGRPRLRIRAWMVAVILGLVVLVAAGMSTRVVSTAEAAAGAADEFDPATYAAEHYEADIVPYVEDNALDLSTLLANLAAGGDEADFGNTSGASSAFAFPVTFTAVAGEPTPPILPLTVVGIPEGTTVQLQIGPAVTGTALRDVTGEISFNDFTNQLEFQNVATELNNQARQAVLDDLDIDAISGKTLTITGAFLRVNPALVSVVPVEVEVAG